MNTFLQRSPYLAIIFAIVLSSCINTSSSTHTDQTLLVYSALQGGTNIFAKIFAKGVIRMVDTGGNRVAVPVVFNKDMWHSEMTWSPNKQWLAYSTAYENAKAGGNSDIFITRWPEQQPIIQLTTNSTNDFHPSWSPDGTMITYQGAGGIFTMDIGCLLVEPKCIVSSVFIVNGSEPVWSPDGVHIAYNGWPDLDNKGKILITELGNTNYFIQISPDNEYCHRPQWSPDGTRLTFDCNSGLYVVNADGSNRKLIAEGGGDAKWSPDGKQIAFIGGEILDPDLGQSVGLGGFDSPGQLSTAIFTVTSDGEELKRITFENNQSIAQFFWITPDMR